MKKLVSILSSLSMSPYLVSCANVVRASVNDSAYIFIAIDSSDIGDWKTIGKGDMRSLMTCFNKKHLDVSRKIKKKLTYNDLLLFQGNKELLKVLLDNIAVCAFRFSPQGGNVCGKYKLQQMNDKMLKNLMLNASNFIRLFGEYLSIKNSNQNSVELPKKIVEIQEALKLLPGALSKGLEKILVEYGIMV